MFYLGITVRGGGGIRLGGGGIRASGGIHLGGGVGRGGGRGGGGRPRRFAKIESTLQPIEDFSASTPPLN